MNMNFFVPTRIITGKGCVAANASEFKKLGNKCLIVTGKSSAEKCGALSDVKNALDSVGIAYRHYNGIGQNPTYASCKEASLQAIDFGADFIIGIGGGSPLDAAKAVAVLASDKDMDMAEMYGAKWEKAPLKIVAVGTTAGTGSEVTPVAVITDTNGLKKSFRDATTYPVLSFGDPTYTMSLPTPFTRSTAVDALCHCVESYFNRATNDICRTFSLQGTAILLDMLEKTATEEELSYDDREKLYCASIYGGLAISVAGTAFPHAFGYFLTEQYGVPHGYACGVYIESFIEYNLTVAPDEVNEFFAALGTTKEEFISLVIKNLPCKNLGIKLSDKKIQELLPRYEENKSLKKCYGTAGADTAKQVLASLFN